MSFVWCGISVNCCFNGKEATTVEVLALEYERYVFIVFLIIFVKCKFEKGSQELQVEEDDQVGVVSEGGCQEIKLR